jgi:hypothetical protein
MIIGQYTIRQSNASRHYQSSVKIIRQGCVIAQVRSDTGNLMNHIRKFYHCDERAELVRQLALAKTPQADIEMLLQIDPK